MIVLSPCPPEIWKAAGRLLASQALFARRHEKLRAYHPIPLAARTAGGSVGDPIGWRFLLRAGRRTLSADIVLTGEAEDDVDVDIAAMRSAPATTRWVAALVALEDGPSGTAAETFELMLAGDRPNEFSTILLIGADGAIMEQPLP